MGQDNRCDTPVSDGSTTDSVLDIYTRMLRAYGSQDWWPAETGFEVIIGAILTQGTAWTNAEKALKGLKIAGAMSPAVLREMPVEDLAKLIYSAGYFNSKARKLKSFAEFLGQSFDDNFNAMAQRDMDTLRADLLSIYGVGDETADDILLYALGKPAFVIDSYTRRLFHRLGLAPISGSYSAYQSIIAENLNPDVGMFREYHALIVRHAQDVCKKQPECEDCCLIDICPTGQG